MLFFILISFFYFYIFSMYLYKQYNVAVKKYYRKKQNYKKFSTLERNRNRENRIKNNTTQRIDQELINNLSKYALLEFVDAYGRTLKTYTIFTDKFTIGREESNDIVLRGQTVSRRQCFITYQNDSFFICNLSNTNFTLLNGIPFEGVKELFYDDIIGIANYTLRFKDLKNEMNAG